MKLTQVKEHYHQGAVKGFRAVHDSEPGCWLLMIDSTTGESWTLDSMLGTQKTFLSLDALVNDVASITGRVDDISLRCH